MAGTGIAVALIAVFLSITHASKLTNDDNHPLAKKEGPTSRVNYIEALSRVLKARDTVKNKIRQGNSKPLKRNSEAFAYQQECTDNHIHCDNWAATGECFNNPIYMHTNCRYSCGICCANTNALCQFWAATGECYKNPGYMLLKCRLSCRECCADNHNLCGYWAATGECFEQMDFMMENCAMSCGQCPGGGINYRRDVTNELDNSPPGTRPDGKPINVKSDVTRDLGSSPPGTREDSRNHLRTDDKLKSDKSHLEY